MSLPTVLRSAMTQTTELYTKILNESLNSTPESWGRIRERVRSLDERVRSGVVHAEIELVVHTLADFVAPIFCDWVEKKSGPESRHIHSEAHWMVAHAFVCFVYLGQHSKKMSLLRAPKKLDARFLDVLGEEIGLPDPMFRAMMQVSLNLVRKFLAEIASDRGH